MKFVAIILALGLIGCGTPTANTPSPVVTVSLVDKLGQDLYILEQSIDAAKTNIASFPQFKVALNKVITSYNVANDAYQAYIQTKTGDFIGLQTQVAQALTDIHTLQASGVKKP